MRSPVVTMAEKRAASFWWPPVPWTKLLDAASTRTGMEMLDTDALLEEVASSMAVVVLEEGVEVEEKEEEEEEKEEEEEESGGADASDKVEYSAEARSFCWIVTRPPPSVNE